MSGEAKAGGANIFDECVADGEDRTAWRATYPSGAFQDAEFPRLHDAALVVCVGAKPRPPVAWLSTLLPESRNISEIGERRGSDVSRREAAGSGWRAPSTDANSSRIRVGRSRPKATPRGARSSPPRPERPSRIWHHQQLRGRGVGWGGSPPRTPLPSVYAPTRPSLSAFLSPAFLCSCLSIGRHRTHLRRGWSVARVGPRCGPQSLIPPKSIAHKPRGKKKPRQREKKTNLIN